MNMKDMKSIGARLTAGAKGRDGLVDAGAIRELAELLKETGLTEIEIELNGARLRVSNQTAGVAVATAPAVAAAAPTAPVAAPAKPAGPNPGAVPSPMVGTVYLSPEPGAKPFVTVGQTVKEGDTLFVVEAMKTMNPIIAPRAGTVSEINVNDAQPVEFGQTLCILN
ncbi:MAG TPA: acetyl-CoA carboxylase biotin carboxyl carrier protein [Rhizomicrobium sp.]|nr:acetyl-CoA carboxylase biotin carboxyl carrier protein [Rhizomicrobium sp.]